MPGLVITLALGLLTATPVVGQERAAAELSRHRLFPIEARAYLLGHFRPDTTPDFARLPPALTGGHSAYLRRDAAEAVAALIQAATEEGVALVVISAMRTFEQQRAIWEGKFTGERLVQGRNLAADHPDPVERSRAILAYSAAPGLSRHHWGTDVDLNSVAMGYWRSGTGRAVLAWLEEHAGKFGFVMAYPPGRELGHAPEPWHWSYQPLARPLLRNYHRRVVSGEDLVGFRGAEAVRRLEWREWYVYGVDELLK